MGNAQLAIVNNKLVVSNVGTSGLDGVMIDVNGNNSTHMNLDSVNINNGGVLKVTNIGKNALNQTATISEDFIWIDNSTNKVQFGINLCLIPKNFNLYGTLNGIPVFDIPTINPIYDDTTTQPTFFAALLAISAFITAAVAVYNALKPSHITTVVTVDNTDGTKTVTTTVVTDPTPITVEVNGIPYLVDNWGIRYTNHNIPAIDANKIQHLNSIQITGFDLGSFEIESIVI